MTDREGALDEVLVDLDRALAAAREAGDKDAEHQLWLAWTRVMRHRRGAPAARGALRGLRTLDEPTGEAPFGGELWADASWELATLMMELDRPEGAAECLDELVYHGPDARKELLRARVAMAEGRRKEAGRAVAEALAAAAREDAPAVTLAALLMVAELAPLDEAFSALAAAAPLAELSDVAGAGDFVLASARFAARGGRPDDAVGLVLPLLSGADGLLSLRIAELFVDLGLLEPALDPIDRAITLCEVEGEQRLLGRAWLAAGRVAPPGPQSIALLEAALSACAGAPTATVPLAHLVLAERWLASDPERATRSLDVGWNLVRERQEPELWVRTDLLRARFAELEGRGEDAATRRAEAESRALEAGLGALTPRLDARPAVPGPARIAATERTVNETSDPFGTALLAVLSRSGSLPDVRAALDQGWSRGGLDPSLASALVRRLPDAATAIEHAVAVAAQPRAFRVAYVAALSRLAPRWLDEERETLEQILQVD